MSIIYNKWFLFFIAWIFYIQTTFSQWTSLSFPSDTDTTSFFNTVFFLNKDTGYIGGYIIIHPGYVPEPHYGAILKTENGGINWSLQTVSCFIQSVFFTDNETGYAVGDNYIYKTIDKPTSFRRNT
ncbi:MAG: hypothetical protein HY738_22725 [Bacteroidia bacterium]|nr:hypothetical protein [Bacteroidia bacterium]